MLRRYLPILDWGRRYDRGTLTSDLLAALIVTIMLIPQSLAYAMLAGLPPIVGLYASILPLIAYAIFGTSRTLSVGPVAIVSLLTATAAGAVAAPGSPEYLAAAITLALLSGMMLLVMGIFRLGFLANLLSHPVVSGFITASAILIATSQLGHILGVKLAGHSMIEQASALIRALPEVNLPTLAIGASTTVFLFWARSGLKPALVRLGLAPGIATVLARTGPVVAVVLSILAVRLFDLTAYGLRVVGEVPQGLPAISLPPMDLASWTTLAPAAFLIAVIGFVESVSVAQTLAAKRRQSIRPDQELIGLGLANLAAAVSGGYPVSGGFARSVVNFDAGAETPAAGAFTALGIALASLFLTPLLHDLPIAVLAATIIVAVLSLIDLSAIRRSWAFSRFDFAALAGTILVTLGWGVESGIITGVLLSVMLHLWQSSRPHVAVIGQIPGSQHFRNTLRHDVVCAPEVLSLRIDESLFFANARAIEDIVQQAVAERSELRHVVLNCAAVNGIDGSALESLELIMHRLADAGIALHLSEVKGPVMERLARSDLVGHLTGRVFLSHHEALTSLAPAITAACDRADRHVIDATQVFPAQQRKRVG